MRESFIFIVLVKLSLINLQCNEKRPTTYKPCEGNPICKVFFSDKSYHQVSLQLVVLLPCQQICHPHIQM